MRIPPATQALLWALGLGFVLQKLLPEFTAVQLWLWPLGHHVLPLADGSVAIAPPFRPWQLVTYAFQHDPGNFGHVFFNAFALFQFGQQVEFAWGTKRFLFYYFFCAVGAGLLQLAVAAMYPEGAGPVLGASGAVYGVLLAYGMLFPNQRLMLLFPPIPMKARTMVIVFGALELLLGFTGMQPGVAHFVHLGGMAFGWALIRYWRARGGRRPPPVAF